MNKYLLTFLVFCVSFIVRAQIPTPSVTQSQSGTVVPIQCLGCLPMKEMQLPLSAGGFRSLTVGDFMILNSSKSIAGLARLRTNTITPSIVRLTIDDLNENPFVLNIQPVDADWERYGDVVQTGREGWYIYTVKAVGIYTRQGQPWTNLIVPNGVCKGPIIRVAKQHLIGGDNKPIAPYTGADPITAKGYIGIVSTEAGINTLSPSHPLVCTGDLIDADAYYKDLVDKQLQEIIRDLASRTSTEKMRNLMQEVLRAYLLDLDKEIVESTARLVVDEMIERGLVVSATPIKPPAPNNLKTPPK